MRAWRTPDRRGPLTGSQARILGGVAIASILGASCGLDLNGTRSGDAFGGAGGPSRGSADSVRPTSCERCATPPEGWSPVAVVVGNATAACPTGSTHPRGLLDNVRSAEEGCTCSCGPPQGNPCFHTDVQLVMLRVEPTGTCTEQTPYTRSGQCTPGTGKTAHGVAGTAPAPQKLECAASAKPPALDRDALTVCDVDTSAGACQAGAVCLDARVCLVHEGGAEVCPPGFGDPHLVGREEDLRDERQCATCSCQTTAETCLDAQIAFYKSLACVGPSAVAKLDGACNAVSPPTQFGAAIYTATPDKNECKPASAKSEMVGSASFDSPRTLCCPP